MCRPGGLTGATIRIDGLASMLTDVLVWFERSNVTLWTIPLSPAAPSFVVEASSGRLEVVGIHLKLGVEHIQLGVDHLLFVVALLIPVQGTRRLVATVTAFTLAHSITLAAATLGVIQVPGPPVEACVALRAEIVQEVRARPASRRESRGLSLPPWACCMVWASQVPVRAPFLQHRGRYRPVFVHCECRCVIIALRRVPGLAKARAVRLGTAYVIVSLAAFWAIARIATFSG